jgi:hypothetical protein
MRENSSNNAKRRFITPRLCVSAVIIFHLLIVLPLAYVLNIWSDEASTLYTTQNGLAETFRHVFADEKQAPLYFLLLSLWRMLSHSIFFARCFSIVFAVLAITVFYHLACKFFDAKAAGLITAFFALHPFLIWTSLEIRGYSLVVLFSVLLLKFFFDGFLSVQEVSRKDAKTQRKAQIFYVLLAIAALYTNYYLGFLLVGNFLALVAARKWRTARIYFLQMLLVGVVILPLLWMIKTQLNAATGDVQTHRTLTEGVRLIWNSGLNFILPTELFPPEALTPVSLVRVWVVRLMILIIAFLLIKRRRALDAHLFAFGAISAATVAFLLVAYFLLGDLYVEIRHAAVLFAPLVLFVALVLKEILTVTDAGTRGYGDAETRRDGETEKLIPAQSSFSPRPRVPLSPRLLLLLLLPLLLLFAYSITALYPQAAKRGDWARVAAYIEQHERPDQPIIVFTVFDALNLPYHYRGANKVLPDERFFNWGIEGAYGEVDSLKPEIDFAISKIPREAREIWLATGERCQTTKACEPLENFVAANYTVIEEKDFYKERVRLLRKK